MAWIELIDPEDARGSLAQIYHAAVKRAGKVFNILKVQSPRPHVLQASMGLYTEVMRSAESGLTRAQREMIATVVSRTNGCFY